MKYLSLFSGIGGFELGIQQDRVYDTEGLMCTLPADNGHDKVNIFEKDMRVRRLTPLECERLMAYPDGWTEGLSDTQRYKTLGNGIVSNVVAEVVKRLL